MNKKKNSFENFLGELLNNSRILLYAFLIAFFYMAISKRLLYAFFPNSVFEMQGEIKSLLRISISILVYLPIFILDVYESFKKSSK